MGKTALATNIAYNVAAAYQRRDAAGRLDAPPSDGGIVGFFSLEMSAEQLATRILAEQTEIPSYKIRRGDISESDFDKLAPLRADDADRAALYRRYRRHLHRPAARRARGA